MADEPLAVFIGGRRAGVIEQRRRGLRLEYDPGYMADPGAVPLSLSLPLRRPTATGPGVEGWLSGLLPGDERVRRRWAARHDARSPAPFDLLSTPAGLDCPGAVQTCPRSVAHHITRREGGVHWLTTDQMESLVEEMVSEQHWVRAAGRSAFSLAGAAAKTALRYQGGRWGEPWGATASTHILKPSLPDLADQALNEHLCLTAARYCGLIAARTEPLAIGPHTVVAVRRYDRYEAAGGGIERVHQEDFHQACGDPAAGLYQYRGGHHLSRFARLLAEHSLDPQTDRERFFDALAYNWIICNSDAHSKNYSLLLGPHGARLAPLYDIWSLLPHDPRYARSYSMAMHALDDSRISAADGPEAWTATARMLGLKPDDGLRRAARIARDLPAAFERAADGLPSGMRSVPLVATLAARLAARSRHCVASLKS